jgi:hypothetical protein
MSNLSSINWQQIKSYLFDADENQILDYILDFQDNLKLIGPNVEAADGHFSYWCEIGLDSEGDKLWIYPRLMERQALRQYHDPTTGEIALPLENQPVGKIDLIQKKPGKCKLVLSIPKTYPYAQGEQQILILVKQVWRTLIKGYPHDHETAIVKQTDPPSGLYNKSRSGKIRVSLNHTSGMFEPGNYEVDPITASVIKSADAVNVALTGLMGEGQATAVTEPGIPSNLLKQLRTALLECGPFTSDQELKAVFVDERLSPWHHQIPQAQNPTERVERVVEFLHTRHNDKRENALALFLRVLSERPDKGDACHQHLADLGSELEDRIKSRTLKGQ